MQKLESSREFKQLIVKNKENNIRRGDIYLIKGEGIDYYGRNAVPALVLQNNRGNRFSPTTIMALATLQREVHKGNIVFDFLNISTIDKGRIIKKIGTVPYAKMIEVNQQIRNSVIGTVVEVSVMAI